MCHRAGRNESERKAMNIINVENAIEQTYLNAILYGETGFGKTYSIASIPEQEKTLILSVEAGLKTLQNMCPETKCAVIRSRDDMRDAYKWLANPGNHKFQTVVIDSLSEIAEIILESEKSNCADGRVYYSETTASLLSLCRLFRELPMNVLFLCQQEKIQDADGRIFYGPAFPGRKTAQKLPYKFDIVAALRVRKNDAGETERAFQLEPDESYVAKARGDNFQAFEKPDWGIIFEKYQDIDKADI